MNLEQFWVASGGHFGVIFGAFVDFNFKAISGPVFVRFWNRFGAQVGEQKQPKSLEGCSKSRFSACRVRLRFGNDFGTIWEPSWEPKSVQNRAEMESKIDAKIGPVWGSNFDPKIIQNGRQDRPQKGPKTIQKFDKILIEFQTVLEPVLGRLAAPQLPATRLVWVHGER